jgi:hypothetical protein
VAGNIASTGNPGNLHSPLRAIQVLGVWLGGSYKVAPAGAALTITHLLVAVAVLAAIAGAAALVRAREWALLAWFGLMLIAWLVVSRSVTTWASAKTLMLTSPAVLLLAWAGVGAVRRLPARGPALAVAALLALALAGGVLVSDVLQYRSSNLAPTARYEELASVGSRFAGGGPALFTDFDEYALYELRRLDIGGPDFAYPPPALAAAAGGYGQPVQIDRIAPAALAGYPLIVTRRDPSLARPPAAYELAWRGRYYDVWRRRPGARPALQHQVLSGTPAVQCRRLAALAARAAGRARGGALAAAPAPVLERADIAAVSPPRGWGRQRGGLAMKRAGTVELPFALPFAGTWQLWIQGQMMPTVGLALDGRTLPSIAGQLGGNSLVPGTVPPIRLDLAAGSHTLTVRRAGATLAPGDGGSAVLAAVLLTPAGTGVAGEPMRTVAIDRWQRLCGRSYQWVELLGSA